MDEDKVKEFMLKLAEDLDKCSDNIEKIMIQYIKDKEELEKKNTNKEHKDKN